jgi:hypothetical protein
MLSTRVVVGRSGDSGVNDGDAVGFRWLGDWLAGLPEHADVPGHRLDQ